MLLALDAGNTSVTVGLFQRGRLIAQGWVPTSRCRTAAEAAASMKRLLKKLQIPPSEISGAILSSVVPRATVALKQALRRLIRPKLLVLGESVRAPILNRYRVPAQVGQDRLVNAVAAYELYGGPAIVVDFGTAITIDLVSRRREYLGGLIVPGIEISLEALSNRATLLPKIQLHRPKEFLGRDTISSMMSGIFFGYSSLCDGIVSRMRSRHAPRAKVIATGGYAALIAPYCRTVRVINPQLTLQGLELIYRAQKNY